MRTTLPTFIPSYTANSLYQLRHKSKIRTFLILVVLAVLFSAHPITAQNVNTYDFAATTGTFTPIMVGAGATAVPAIKANDAISTALPIGFTFNYDGGTYNTIYASSNGFLTFFGASPLPPTNGSNPLTTASTGSMAIIAPLWADLNVGGVPSAAEASYQTTGVPGSRVFTFQWLNWKWGNTSTFDQDISFQVKLYEGSDKIEFYYRRDALNTTIYYLASIGLAGPSTGSPDILFVRYPATPHTSITTEGGHNTRPVSGQIYTFTKSALKDIAGEALAYPLATTCGANVPVTVTVKNMGGVALDFSVTPLTVTGSITGPGGTVSPSVIVNTGTLAVNATLDVVVDPNFDMTAAGSYSFGATASITGDGRPNNNSIPAVTRTVSPIATLPQNVNFNGFNGTNLNTLSPGWDVLPAAPGGTLYWGSINGFGAANNGSTFFLMNDNVRQGWIKGPKINATATTELRFKAAITEWGTFNAYSAGMSGTDDKVYVMVSTDCGTTFSPIFTYDATNFGSLNNNLLEQPPISLAAYAGQTIIVGFFATEGSVNNTNAYQFHLDDIFIGTPLSTDLGVTVISNPLTNGCYGSAEAVTVTIKNFGSNTIDFTSINAQVQARVTGTGSPTPTVLTTTLNTGSLAPGATQAVSLPAINMSAAGNYNFSIYTTISGDNNTVNDTISTSRTATPTFAMPNAVDFTGYSGTNFSSLFPGWWRTDGATPDPNPSPGVYSWSPWTGLGNASNKTAFVWMEDNFTKQWLIGPKIMATANSELRLKVAITEALTNNLYTPGMSGTDDKVQIMVSTDCGFTFSPFFTFDASNTTNITNVLSERTFSLGSFAGQQIIVAIYGTDGTINNSNNYFFHIDDLLLRNVSPIDMAPVQAITKQSGCGLTATEQICVIVKNEGSLVQSNIPVFFRVNNGPAVNEIIPGPIQPGDTIRYCFTGTADLAANNTYAIIVFTGLANDGAIGNDTIVHSVISYNPVNVVATGNSRCGSGLITLTATAPNNLPINWYAAPTGGTAIANGSSFSPSVNTTTTYYAEAASGIEITGKPASTSNFKATIGSLYFNASQSFDLISVVVYTDLAAGGNLVINLKNASNTIIRTTTFSLPPVSGKTAVTVPLNFTNIPAGNEYRLELGSPISLYRDQVFPSNPVFPVISPSKTINITRSSTSDFYNFFFNWTISLCASSQRVPVVATVNPAPVVNLGPTITQCGSTPVTLDAGNAGSTYQWSLNGTAISGATSQTYSATAPGSYSVSVTNANSCSTTGTVQVSFSTVATPTVTAAGPLTFCQGGSVSLTGTTATTGVTYQWLMNNAPVSGATSANLSVNTSGNYRLVASLSGCSDTSAVTTVTVNAKPATPTITLASGSTTICQGSSATLTGATTTTGVSYRWSLNGAPIAGATSATYTASQPGAYRVIATAASGCVDSSAVTTITVNPKPATPTITLSGTTLTASATTGTYQWYSVSGTTLTPVPGATSAIFIPTVSGDYTVVVTVGGCDSDAAVAMNVVVVGIGKLAPGLDISIYPNPTAGRFEVQLTGFEKEATIQILNVTGQVISETTVAVTADKTSKAFDLGGMAKGVYILKVTSGDNLTFRKVVLD